LIATPLLAPFVAIKEFPLPSNTPPPSGGDKKKLVAPKGMVGIICFKKMILHAPAFFGDRKVSIPIQHTPIIKWCDQKGWGLYYHFGKIINFMLHFLSWVTEKFQVPFDGVSVLDGN